MKYEDFATVYSFERKSFAKGLRVEFEKFGVKYLFRWRCSITKNRDDVFLEGANYDPEPVNKEAKWLYSLNPDIETDNYLDLSLRIPEEVKDAVRQFTDDEWDIYCEQFDSDRTVTEFWKHFSDCLKEVEEENKRVEKEKASKEYVKLNDSYTAEFSKGGKYVKVGCQKFSVEKIKELATKL